MFKLCACFDAKQQEAIKIFIYIKALSECSENLKLTSALSALSIVREKKTGVSFQYIWKQ